MIGYERRLLERQAQLRSRAAAEREHVVHSVAKLQPFVTLGDRAVRLGRAIYSQRWWVALGAATVTIVKPRIALRAGRNLWIAWQTIRSARRYLLALAPGKR